MIVEKNNNKNEKINKNKEIEKNIKIVFEYNGNAFFGLQKQPNLKTVQGILEDIIYDMTGEKSNVNSSGRTDRYVSALGQVANFKTKSNIQPENFKLYINTRCKGDLIVKSAEYVDINFHSRFDAKRKTYIYIINNTQSPSAINFSKELFVKNKLNLEKMKIAIKDLEGIHDFEAFQSMGSPRETTVREIYSAQINVLKNDVLREERIVVSLTGNGFLYNMVRIIVGTLIEIGLDKKEVSVFKDMINRKDRSLGGKTIDPKGLFLKNVEY